MLVVCVVVERWVTSLEIEEYNWSPKFSCSMKACPIKDPSFPIDFRFSKVEIGQELGDYCQANGKSSCVSPTASVGGFLVDSDRPFEELEV